MLTSCWSRDISKRGLIKLPPCGGGKVGGEGRRGGRIQTRRGSARNDKTESTRSRCAPRLYRPQGLRAWSQPGSWSLLSWTLTNLFPTHSNYQDTSNRGERGEGIWEEKVYRWQSMSGGKNAGAELGRWRYWKLLDECFFFFFLAVDNYFV